MAQVFVGRLCVAELILDGLPHSRKRAHRDDAAAFVCTEDVADEKISALKFVAILAGALAKRKRRVKTGVPRGSREKRIEGKKRRGKTKQTRGRVDL